MTLTTHALVGAAAASLFPEHPYAAFTAGFVSHLAIDAIPHWDYTAWLKSVQKNPLDRMDTDMVIGRDFVRDLAIIAADAILGTILAVLILGNLGFSIPIILVGAWAGQLPDFLQFVYYKTRLFMLEPLQEFHNVWLQSGKHHPEWGALNGLLYQAILCAAVILVLTLTRA